MLEFKSLSGFLNEHVLSKFSGRIGEIILIMLGLILLSVSSTFLVIMIKKRKWGFTERIFHFFSGMKAGILTLKRMDNKAGFLLSSVLIWVLYGLSSYFCFFALNATSSLGPGAALSTLVFGSLAMIAPVQGGIGAFHWMVSEGLLAYGISKTDGLSYALLVHTSQTIIILFIGSLSLILFIKESNRKQSNE